MESGLQISRLLQSAIILLRNYRGLDKEGVSGDVKKGETGVLEIEMIELDNGLGVSYTGKKKISMLNLTI